MGKRHRRNLDQVRRKVKVKLPTDRNGIPINVGDWLGFEDGSVVMVESLTWMGDELGWYAGNDKEECASDNLSAGHVLCDISEMMEVRA